MEDTIAQVQAQSPEVRAVVRRFSEQESFTAEYPNVVHAVASYGRQERELEASKWRSQFEDKYATRSVMLF